MNNSMWSLIDSADKKALESVDDYLNFANDFLHIIEYNQSKAPGIQAAIISTSNPNYMFFQYNNDLYNKITRPINRELFINANSFITEAKEFKSILHNPESVADDYEKRNIINRVIYTTQQAIGCVLDTLNNSNKSRKLNGTHFEKLIRLVVKDAGIDVINNKKTIKLSDKDKMSFERDIVLLNGRIEKAVGQIKTSTKDRLAKIFIEKELYQKQINKIPYFAIILNDVQRAETKKEKYMTSSTFLPGSFRIYTMTFNALDGVYYIDMSPKIEDDDFLSKHIFKFDQFIVKDMWNLIK